MNSWEGNKLLNVDSYIIFLNFVYNSQHYKLLLYSFPQLLAGLDSFNITRPFWYVYNLQVNRYLLHLAFTFH